jgi:hypothetical protein
MLKNRVCHGWSLSCFELRMSTILPVVLRGFPGSFEAPRMIRQQTWLGVCFVMNHFRTACVPVQRVEVRRPTMNSDHAPYNNKDRG